MFAGLAEYGADTARNVVADALIRRADQRIAATLLRVTAVREGMVPDSPDGFLISQAELAEMANASRNYVNLTLKSFADRGWGCAEVPSDRADRRRSALGIRHQLTMTDRSEFVSISPYNGVRKGTGFHAGANDRVWDVAAISDRVAERLLIPAADICVCRQQQ